MADVSLQGGMEQRQTLSVAMQRNLQILQASSMELLHLINQALDANPVLEEEPPVMDYDDWPDTQTGASHPDAGIRHDFLMESLTSPVSLVDHLVSQIHTSDEEEGVKKAAEYIAGSLDEKGFLDTPLAELSLVSGFKTREMEKGLCLVRQLDPAGVGAFDLRDSLLIQLERKEGKNSLAYQLAEDWLPDVARRKEDYLADKLGVSSYEIRNAIEQLGRLNPNPGSEFGSGYQHTIIPDMEVVESDQGFEIIFTKENFPRLKLNDGYKATLMENSQKPEIRRYLKNCFHDARQLIHAIELREETLVRLAEFIVQKEREFFYKGARFLKPLGMNEAAEFLGVHPTTVSRAVAGKYLHCRFGLFELRFFFSSGYETETGDTLSSHAVREAISQLVHSEDKTRPYSDNKLATLLHKKGITVARRTVAKYREQLKILPARFRKAR